jgi:diguanylate cyclase (GGDEF)-like protein
MSSEMLLMLVTLLFVFGVLSLGILHLKYWKLLNTINRYAKGTFPNSAKLLVSLDSFIGILAYILNNPRDTSKLVVSVISFDNLSTLKNLIGEEDGDLVISEAVGRMKLCIRSNDLIAKYDENSFTLMLSRISTYKDIELVIQRILTSLQQPFLVKNRELRLIPFIGVSVHPNNGSAVETLLSNAFSAMIMARSEDESCYHFFAKDKTSLAKDTVVTVRDLRYALQENQFVLHYQPQVSVETGEVTGVEALVRWEHPTKGLILPTNFIPVAESSGLIIPLGYWILREACKQYREWNLPHLKMSVNLSAYQFKQVDLVSRIKEIIREEGMEPTKLDLEITESTSMSDISFTLHVLSELRSMGLPISIDDFGTGHSSLSYLKQFPITSLKIDRSFIEDSTKDENGAIFVSSIIDLAKRLGLNVVAEGVETEDQLNLLRELDCDNIQGYYYSPPLPSDKLLLYLEDFTSNVF